MIIIQEQSAEVNTQNDGGDPARECSFPSFLDPRRPSHHQAQSPGEQDRALQECNPSGSPGPLGSTPGASPLSPSTLYPDPNRANSKHRSPLSPTLPQREKSDKLRRDRRERRPPLGNVPISEQDSSAAKYIGVTDHRKLKLINRLTVYPGGTTAQRFKGSKTTPPVGVRGIIRGFSTASRRRLRRVLIAVPWESVDTVWVSLTYHLRWGQPQDCKYQLKLLRKRLFYHFPGTLLAIPWRLEFQRRGAPHFHLLLVFKKGKRPQETWLKRYVCHAWAEIIDTLDDRAALKHGVKLVHVGPQRGGIGALLGYLVNEMGKVSQSIRVDPATGEILPTGRMWGGTRGLPLDPGIAITLTEAHWLKMLARLNKHGHKVRSWYLTNLTPNWAGFTILGSVSQIAAFFEHWDDP